LFFLFKKMRKQGMEEKHMGLMCAAQFTLIHDCVESDADSAHYNLISPTFKGKANIGDWEIIVRRRHPLGSRIRDFFRDIRSRIQRRETLEVSQSRTGIFFRWLGQDGRDKTQQIIDPPKDTLH